MSRYEKEIEQLEARLAGAADQLAEIRESCSIVRMQDHFDDTPLQAVRAQQAMQTDQLVNSKRLYEMTLRNEMDWMRKWQVIKDELEKTKIARDKCLQLLATRVEASRLDEACDSTHRQAHCINQCAAHIGTDTPATIDGLPLAVKHVVYQRNEAERLRDDWCSQFVKARNTLRAIFALTNPHADGNPDASPRELMCHEISQLILGCLGFDAVDENDQDWQNAEEDWHDTERHEGE